MTESLTNATEGHVPDAVFELPAANSPKRNWPTSRAIAAISAWNRVAIALSIGSRLVQGGGARVSEVGI